MLTGFPTGGAPIRKHCSHCGASGLTAGMPGTGKTHLLMAMVRGFLGHPDIHRDSTEPDRWAIRLGEGMWCDLCLTMAKLTTHRPQDSSPLVVPMERHPVCLGAIGETIDATDTQIR